MVFLTVESTIKIVHYELTDLNLHWLPEKARGDQYAVKSEEFFYRVMQMADNAGAIDEHRCLNYLTVRYPVCYEKVVEMYNTDHSLTAIEVVPSRLNAGRKILDCIYTYTNRKSDVNEKWFCRVDVTEMFPFLVTKMSPYFDR